MITEVSGNQSTGMEGSIERRSLGIYEASPRDDASRPRSRRANKDLTPRSKRPESSNLQWFVFAHRLLLLPREFRRVGTTLLLQRGDLECTFTRFELSRAVTGHSKERWSQLLLQWCRMAFRAVRGGTASQTSPKPSKTTG